ncbi:hypothetical protein PI124_g7412 [Phytophthora idaei]|nr:hypothetical protein PI125_g17908 [Phytophthora idaei]KAG3159339.1 hypothetical protein PI126_g7439 [Phytophthora idaei]KAG3247881.1 hypothetical protein PI124_g7412 [Phytophthora idaei]
MASSIHRGTGRQSDALAWRREVNRQHEIALEMAKEYQAKEKARRAKEHNETLTRKEGAANSRSARDESTRQGHDDSGALREDSGEAPKSLFEPGSRVWLYMKRFKSGLTKKLAHRCHVPFRVKKKVEEYAYELELPDRSGYRFYTVVHVSRLKPVCEFEVRPTTRLTEGITEDSRLDFDDELLPEDSWLPDHLAREFEIEAILDDRTPLTTTTERTVREFNVKWIGYDEPTWEPLPNLSCGGLLYDYLRRKRSEQRLQMVQVADED